MSKRDRGYLCIVAGVILLAAQLVPHISSPSAVLLALIIGGLVYWIWGEQ